MGYAQDVRHALKEVVREATGSGRGTLTSGQTTKIALGRAGATIKGHGDQGRCSNGKSYCGSCANCNAGSEND